MRDDKGWIWAAFTALAVNDLSVEDPCCPHSCEACAALAALHNDGALTHVLASYVKSSRVDWDWWNPDPASGPDIPGIGRIGCFRWEWVTSRWCDPDTCVDARGDFYEDDEPVEKIVAAFERGEHGVTGKQVTKLVPGAESFAS
jgi:hypothetical protein